MIILTNHGNKRLKQRCGCSKKSAIKLAEIAYEKGIAKDYFTGQLKRYVNKQLYRHDTKDIIVRIYNSFMYIFKNDKNGVVLITIYPLPYNVAKISRDIERKINTKE